MKEFVCEPRATTLRSADFSAGKSSQAISSSGAGASGMCASSNGSGTGFEPKQSQLASDQSPSPESSAPEAGPGLSSAAGAVQGASGSAAATSGGAATAAHSPPLAAGSTSAGAAPASGHSSTGAGCPPARQADSRSVLFFAVLSQKQARIYQVPASAASWSPMAGSGAGGGDKSDKGHHPSSLAHHHHGSPQASHQPTGGSSPPGQLAESPLCKLLANKRNLLAECELSDTSYACRSQVVKWRSPSECCLVSYLATGQVVVHSLPRLRPKLMDADFVPYSNARLAQTMCFSTNGHCLYQPSPGEICKFTISSNYKSLVNEMLGLVYVPREMPEQPRANFFKSLFSVSQASKQSDRDELFGESASGKAAKSVAKHLGGSGASGQPQLSSMEKLKSAAIGTMGHEMRMAREGLDERGERLGELEDHTLNMLNQSETYAQAAHQLAQKFKEKKWYQF